VVKSSLVLRVYVDIWPEDVLDLPLLLNQKTYRLVKEQVLRFLANQPAASVVVYILDRTVLRDTKIPVFPKNSSVSSVQRSSTR
jgi:hypothetical protein